MADNTQAPRCRVSQCGPSARKASGPVSKPTRPCSTCCPAPPPLTHCYSQWKGGPGSWHFLSGKGTHACLCASMCELAFSFCFSFQCCTKLTCLEIVCLKVVCVINLCNLTERQKCIYKDTVSGKTCVSPPEFRGQAVPTEKTSSETSMQGGTRVSPSSPSSPPGCRCTDPDKAALLWAAQRDCCAPVPGALMLWLRPCAHAGTRGRGRETKGGDANTSGICKTLHTTLITSWEKMYRPHSKARSVFPLPSHMQRKIHTPTHTFNCVPTTSTI